MAAFIGLDVGGTFLKGDRLDDSGRIEARLHEPIVRERPEDLLDQFERAVATLRGGPAARAVGIGLPGIVDHASERLRGVPNLKALAALRDRDLVAEVSARTALPAFMENDGNAAGLAEAWLGAGRGASSMIFLTLGTGVGSAVILRDRLWTGQSGYAGEVGHVQIDPRGEPCGCGSRGCLETVVGIAGWSRRAEAKITTRDSRLAGQKLDPAAIVAAAREGDTVAIEVVDETARALGQALGALINILNPERAVIGGGVAAAGAFLLDRVVRDTKGCCWPQAFDDCSIRLAELGGDAGVVGAARVAMRGVLGQPEV
ncbi:MAG TPA: ROK family protein [Vicinamibacteria bacterium]